MSSPSSSAPSIAPTASSEPQFLTVDEAADLLRVNRRAGETPQDSELPAPGRHVGSAPRCISSSKWM